MRRDCKGRKRKQGVVSLLLTALIVCTLTGCGGAPGRQEAETTKGNTKVVLNEVAHSVFYAPMYVAIEEGYFTQEGIELELITGYGADKTMTALLTDEADIGFMGSESSIYTYLGGTQDYAVNFAQLTQRAGNFLVAREPVENFDWSMLKGQDVLGGRAGFDEVARLAGVVVVGALLVGQLVLGDELAFQFQEVVHGGAVRVFDEEDAAGYGVAVVVQTEVEPFEQVGKVVHGQLQVDGGQGQLGRLAFVEEDIGILVVVEDSSAEVGGVVGAHVHHFDVVVAVGRGYQVRLYL